jgi:adenylylsulfate kinase-like enzyme
MIYWFTGQPSSGKTTLALLLKQHLQLEKKNWRKDVFHVDGDHLREIYKNKDYSEQGRRTNIKNAQSLVEYLHICECDVVVSIVAPYKDLRDEFKERMGDNLIELYVHTTEERERDHYHVKDYQPPSENYIDIDTTLDSPEESLVKILNQI